MQEKARQEIMIGLKTSTPHGRKLPAPSSPWALPSAADGARIACGPPCVRVRNLRAVMHGVGVGVVGGRFLRGGPGVGVVVGFSRLGGPRVGVVVRAFRRGAPRV